MRIISNVGYRDSTNDLFYNLKIVKFYDLIKIKICVAIYKAKYSILPSNLLSLIDLNLNTVYNTRNSCKFSHIFARTTLKSMCISVNGVKLFNNLSDDVINSKNSKQFCTKLKMCVVDSYKSNVPFFPSFKV